MVVYKKLHGIEVALDASANKVCNAYVGQNIGVAEGFARIDVGHVHLDNGDTNTLDAIAKGVAVVRVGAGIEHNGIAIRLLKDVDKFAFDVALGANHLSAKGFGKDQPKLEINNFFKAHLNQFLENTVTPKKWRYLEELPQDTQGKIKMRAFPM